MSETGGDLTPGSQVGEYLIDRKIAEGGMGAVYAGHHPVIGKRVAVKVLSPSCASVPDLVRRFVEEARAVNKIGHPNIIDIFSFGTLADARPYFVMEYLEGANLAVRLESGTLSIGETKRILRQICSGLEAAHRTGIVHRDLKPENVWIASPAHEDSYAKVLDFGIAKLLDNPQARNTQTGAAMGTPRYMAPEQCMGRGVDHRADIYSLGVILYEIFAGIVPFRGETFGELLYQHMSEAPEPPSRHRPIDPELEAIILACLEKDPARRPESAKELARRLEPVLARGNQPDDQPIGQPVKAPIGQPVGPSIAARPTGSPATTMGQSVGEVIPVRPGLPGARRRTTRAVVAGATTALAVVVVGLLFMRGRPPPIAVVPAPPPPPPVAAAPTAAASGRLQLRIQNGQADRVSLDGREIAHHVATVDLPGVPAGEHVVSIEGGGGPVQNTPVTIAAGGVSTLSVALAAPEQAVPRPVARHAPVRPPAAAPTNGSPPTGAGTPGAKPSRAEERGLMDENPFRKQ